MAAASNKNAATAAQIKQGITTTLGSADAGVQGGLNTLYKVHQARLSLAVRTTAALQAQYGADDVRVSAAQARQSLISATISRVAVLRAQNAAPDTPAAATGWVLQGNVLDAALQPASRYTVFLVDANKAYLRQFGFAYTDVNGGFVINYKGEAAAEQAANPDMFIEIADPQANPVYLADTAFAPAAGSTSVQTIMLPAGGKPIGDPPAALRAEAFPPEVGTSAGST